ncbi:MAG: tyrosine-type recombinase/integrase [Flavobacteriales bacterium]|jgi:integrase/recombinase XerC|nr:tyrosine-type recombinase/integrase [Flavobacteriales bacterium]MDO7613780.1 tyrosine-type recombinase/integrase [Crocinitomicaceae bacterium]
MFDKFISYLQFEKRYSNHTILAYRQDLDAFKEFAELEKIAEFSDLSSSFIRSWIVYLIEGGMKNKSVNRKLASLRTFYKWLRKEGVVDHSPMTKVKGPKSEKHLPVFAKESELSLPNMEHLFTEDFSGQRDALMLELFYQTGMRLSELIGLKIYDVQGNQVKVLGKRNKERIIPISDGLVKQIELYVISRKDVAQNNDSLLVLNSGHKLYPTFAYRKINYYLGEVTSLDKKSPHILRHTFATHMLNRGTGLETLKDLLGHANLAATQVYTHNSFAQLNSIYSQAHPRGHKTN